MIILLSTPDHLLEVKYRIWQIIQLFQCFCLVIVSFQRALLCLLSDFYKLSKVIERLFRLFLLQIDKSAFHETLTCYFFVYFDCMGKRLHSLFDLAETFKSVALS